MKDERVRAVDSSSAVDVVCVLVKTHPAMRTAVLEIVPPVIMTSAVGVLPVETMMVKLVITTFAPEISCPTAVVNCTKDLEKVATLAFKVADTELRVMPMFCPPSTCAADPEVAMEMKVNEVPTKESCEAPAQLTVISPALKRRFVKLWYEIEASVTLHCDALEGLKLSKYVVVTPEEPWNSTLLIRTLTST